MSGTKLNEHRFDKGKFISPWNDIGIDFTEKPWFQNRLPEYLWIGLIFDKYDRDRGMDICGQIIQYLKNYNIQTLCMSELLNLEESQQKEVWSCIAKKTQKSTLSPLTSILTFSRYPAFAEYFSSFDRSLDDNNKKIGEVLKKAADHQSHFATDIRFIVLYFLMIKGRLQFTCEARSSLDLIVKYPYLSHDDEEMKMIRPLIRSAEISVELQSVQHREYIEFFWENVSIMTDCKLFSLVYEKDASDTDVYLEHTGKIMQYYSDMFTSAYPLDNKMLVLLGIATYSYKRILELVNCNLYNEISGRSIVRILIENYITMRYLLKREAEHDDIWEDYQYYGIGQYKLIAKRADNAKKNIESSHVPYEYINILVDEFRMEQFVDMDTKYFDRINVREKANDIGEKELFGLYYDYDSAFEHGLWGAIRESSLLKCEAAGHQYHCVPDIKNVQKMKSVWSDAKMAMNKLLLVLKETYGLPDEYSLDGE